MTSRALRELERELEALSPREGAGEGPAVPTGLTFLDRLLPGGGLPRGRAVEWRGERSCGKTALLRAVLRRLAEEGEPVALVDVRRTLYAPDWLDLAGRRGRFWVVRCPGRREAPWCTDLLLRSRAFGAVALVPGEEGEARLGGGTATRLQRLAEEARATLLVMDEVPVAGLRLRFRTGRLEPLRDGPFAPRLPPVRPLWVRVQGGKREEVPVLCPVPRRGPSRGEEARDRKGRR